MATVSHWPDALLSKKKKRVIQQLAHGQECATQLQILFDNPSQQNGHSSAKELMQNILTSFDQTLAALTTSIDSAADDDDDNEGFSESTTKRPAGSKDKRGCYQRKKGVKTWKTVSATMEDGNAWRKYGQKKILNSKHPRGYFRCSHKYDQGCGAMKQVQRLEDDPQMYETTYIGTHTCTDSYGAPQMIIPGHSESWGSHPQIPNSSAASPSVKKEPKEDTTEGSECTDLDPMVWKEIIGGGGDGGFEYSSEHGMGSDYGDCCRGLEYGFLNNHKGVTVEFENGFHFDESECTLMV